MFLCFRRELNLTNSDVPNKSKRDNEPDSKTDQFLTITVTDLEKDCGQTTIPFIDVKEVITSPLTPLTGIGLFHKGQPGYGGFMGLRLLTYNITSQIDDTFIFDSSILDYGLKKLIESKHKYSDKLIMGRKFNDIVNHVMKKLKIIKTLKE